jgi:hypothetical protein
MRSSYGKQSGDGMDRSMVQGTYRCDKNDNNICPGQDYQDAVSVRRTFLRQTTHRVSRRRIECLEGTENQQSESI